MRYTPQGTTYAELLTESFYRWELRGRGWSIFDYPVDLEPFFRPCTFAPRFAPDFDDGRKVGFIRKLLSSGSAARALIPTPSDNYESVIEAVDAKEIRRRVLRVSVPGDCRVAKRSTERLLTSLGYLHAPVSFELVGRDYHVHCQLSVAERDASAVEQTIRAFVPEASILVADDELLRVWNAVDAPRAVVDFGLSAEFMVPLSAPSSFDPHPLASGIAALANIGSSGAGVLQVLVQPVRHPWAKEMLRAVQGPSGDGMFEDAPQLIPQTREKAALPLFVAIVRVAAAADDEADVLHIARSIASTFGHLASASGNGLIPLTNERYPDEAHARDLLARTSRRSGMILNAQELACLVHVPDGTLEIEGLDRDARRTRALPGHLRNREGVLLGENHHRGAAMAVRLTMDERMRHTLVIGGSGGGKSTLLANLILQDLEAGVGVAVLDPHGDLVEEIAGHMPASRLEDVTYLDPSDPRGLVPMNMLSARTETERIVLGADLASVLRRYVTTWGDQMSALLGAAVTTALEAMGGGTLLDLRRLLVDAPFRNDLLTRVGDTEALFYWQKVFPHVGIRAIGPLLARLDTFLRPRPVRAIVAGEGAGLDVPALLNGGVLLARLAQGIIGEENAHILGSLIATKINQAALAREQVDPSARRPFMFYVDEAHAFTSASMASILSGGRKHQLGIVLCHQEWDQWRRAPEVGSAVLANAYTRVCFRLGDADAKRFAEGTRDFVAADFANLGIGQAIVRLGDAGSSFNLNTVPLAPSGNNNGMKREEVIATSASRYGLPPADVDTEDRPSTVHARNTERPVHRPPPLIERNLRHGAKATPESPDAGGRGGREHRYLQHLAKRLAEERGFRASIEEDVDGARIDVALYCNDLKIACQIALTSPAEYEAKGVAKCLASGFSRVLLLGADDRHIKAIQRACSTQLDGSSIEKVSFVKADNIVETLDALVPLHDQSVSHGYKVKVSRHSMTPEQIEKRHKLVGSIVARSLRARKDT